MKKIAGLFIVGTLALVMTGCKSGASDKKKVINYLTKHGSGERNYVETVENAKLGYAKEKDWFIILRTVYSYPLASTTALVFGYMEEVGAQFDINRNGIKYFSVYFTFDVINHDDPEYKYVEVMVDNYESTYNSMLSRLIVDSVDSCISITNKYLVTKKLPYIF